LAVVGGGVALLAAAGTVLLWRKAPAGREGREGAALGGLSNKYGAVSQTDDLL
jgi:hypothetical protein